MSRSWPEASKYPHRPSIPTSSATVIWTWSIVLWSQLVVKSELAKRSASRFSTVSLPR